MSKPNLYFFKKSSAVQVTTIPSKKNKYGIEKYGAVLLEIANGSNGVIEWKEKGTFALSHGDLPTVFESMLKFKNKGKIELKLIHSNNDNIKTLSIKNGKNPLTYEIALYFKDSNSNKVNRYSYLSFGELYLLFTFIEQSLNKIIG